ncbi:MAG: hypothetical protein F6J86_37790, partial [Symploca sp. SIO1B1]|nr:hypothetical protein [Symploca sp. SIO1B1]
MLNLLPGYFPEHHCQFNVSSLRSAALWRFGNYATGWGVGELGELRKLRKLRELR